MTDQSIRKMMNKIDAAGHLVQWIAFALVVASRKLHHYFQAHTIIVMIVQPIRKTMNKIDAAGHLLVDFIAKFTYPQEE